MTRNQKGGLSNRALISLFADLEGSNVKVLRCVGCIYQKCFVLQISFSSCSSLYLISETAHHGLGLTTLYM